MRVVGDDSQPEKDPEWPDRRKPPPLPATIPRAEPSPLDDPLVRMAMDFVASVVPSEDDEEAYQVQKPTVMSPQVCRDILQLIVEGNYLEPSCRAAGIDLSTFKRWRRRWRKGDPDAAKLGWFFVALPRAEALGQIHTVRRLRGGMPGAWQKDAWFLERRYHGGKGNWRMQAEKEDGKVPEPTKPVQGMSRSELEAYLSELEQADAKANRSKLPG